ncbi:MAG: hypothetical protein B7X95_02050 [Methylophilaceae bacterium 17-44-8]|jgi:hypothetical protein|nr:MAG: hypothetical protein B7Y48_00685 [Methylophilales bacterium 28-44-11]OZA06585.1 MAG: hypothetical protein B7X95_02050 [Methylophilaceae bacterium 17-44-8]
MKLLHALLTHAWLAITFRHNGEGMPTKLLGASTLVSLYISLLLANIHIQQTFSIESLIALLFIAQLYVFSLRNRIIGLIILIGVIANACMLLVHLLTGIPQQQLYAITLMEYAMVFSAVLNVIKYHLSTTEF